MPTAIHVPSIRLRTVNDLDVRPERSYVLYWMTAFRRCRWNFALQRAIDWALQLKRPLVVFEPLQCDYPWASDRLHHFVIQGMADNGRYLATTPALYYPFLEMRPDAGKGLLGRLAADAAVVVGDDYPGFFLPKILAAAARQTPTRLELVDSNGLLPLRATEKTFVRAYDFRRFLQQRIPPYMEQFPLADPIQCASDLPRLGQLSRAITDKWPAADVRRLANDARCLDHLAIDHRVATTNIIGGNEAAEHRLAQFIERTLEVYAEQRNQPDREATSGMSPYLHFGHISSHQVFEETARHDGWSVDKMRHKATGSSTGWWGASETVEAFWDELITWRELGFNMCAREKDYDRYESLPSWARTTLADHVHDRRDPSYTIEELEKAETHDPLWNACQRQLLRDGRIHNYLRMLWGKKIVQWTRTPQEALQVMIDLNNRYALDGRDPNSYSGIFWVLGRYDRPWGPERPIFGKVRYMSSRNTIRKLRVDGYLKQYGSDSG